MFYFGIGNWKERKRADATRYPILHTEIFHTVLFVHQITFFFCFSLYFCVCDCCFYSKKEKGLNVENFSTFFSFVLYNQVYQTSVKLGDFFFSSASVCVISPRAQINLINVQSIIIIDWIGNLTFAIFFFSLSLSLLLKSWIWL